MDYVTHLTAIRVDEHWQETEQLAWRRILCKRYSTKSRMALRKRGGNWLKPLAD